MKIANTADWHVRGKDLGAMSEQLAAFTRECVRREVDLVIIAGDVFDRPTIGDNHASTGAVAEVPIRCVGELTKHDIDVVMIPGNHDIAGAGSADALHVFDGMDNVTVIREPGSSVVCDIEVISLPWSWESADPEQNFSHFIAESSVDAAEGRSWPNLLLAHVQVTGARMSRTHTAEHKPGTWQISREFLEQLPVDHVALGDFHARQDLAGGRGGYVGALRQCNFGEEGNPAGFEIWDTETNETEWVELDAAPKHRTVVISATEGTLPGRIGNELLRIRYDGGQPDPIEVKQLEKAGIRVEHIVDREERVRRAEVPAGILRKPHDMVRLWASTQEPAIDGARLDRMLRVFDETTADEKGDVA